MFKTKINTAIIIVSILTVGITRTSLRMKTTMRNAENENSDAHENAKNEYSGVYDKDEAAVSSENKEAENNNQR